MLIDIYIKKNGQARITFDSGLSLDISKTAAKALAEHIQHEEKWQETELPKYQGIITKPQLA